MFCIKYSNYKYKIELQKFLIIFYVRDIVNKIKRVGEIFVKYVIEKGL